MYIHKISAYLYLTGETTNRQVEYAVAFSTPLFNMLQQHSDFERIIDWSGLNGTAYRNELRAFFGEDIFPNNLKVYFSIHSNQGRPGAAVDNALRLIGCSANYFNTNHEGINKIVAVQRGVELGHLYSTIGYNDNGALRYSAVSNYIAGSQSTFVTYSQGGNNNRVQYNVIIFPEDIISSDGTVNVDKYIESEINYKVPELEVILYTPDDFTSVSDCRVTVVQNAKSYLTGLVADLNGFKFNGVGDTVEDTDNPYGTGGNSGTGGGNGSIINPDETDGADIPDLPGISAANLGFITMYNPTAAQLKSLNDFMWSNVFDLNTYKKLFSDPMESIIGLSIIPVAPTIGGSKNVMFGTIDSNVHMSYLSTQYVQLDCGSVDIEEWIGSFLDYSPYTKISIYLPYIGIHDLSPDDIMDGSIQVVYNIDCLSGACGCFIKHSSRGVLYSFNGSCISNIPLTAINFSSAIQNAVSAVCSGAGIIAGIATGAAPVTAMSAAGLINSAANTAMNSKPSVQRSGSLGGSAGILSIQKPYVIIERPNMSVPSSIQNYVGQTSNITMGLGGCSGFTMVEYIHLHDIPATSDEVKEIESLLKEGVIL